jgi:uncharacterized protein YlxW (UPF0749 family)
MTNFILYAIICTGIAYLIVNRAKWKDTAKRAQKGNRQQAAIIRDKQAAIAEQQMTIADLEERLDRYRQVVRAKNELKRRRSDEVVEWPEEIDY